MAGSHRTRRSTLSNYPDEITRTIANSPPTLTCFRFDGSDLMPKAVGSGTLLDRDGQVGERAVVAADGRQHRSILAEVMSADTIDDSAASGPRPTTRSAAPAAPTRRRVVLGLVGMVVVVWALANLFLAFGYYPEWFGSKIVIGILAIIGGVGGAALLFYFLNMFVEGLPSRLSQGLIPYAFLLPGFALVALMLIYPTFQTINYSFANSDSTAYVGLENYRTIFGDSDVLDLDRQQHPVAAHRAGHRRRLRRHRRGAVRQALGWW